MDKIKHSFNSIASKQGSYSVGLTALVIAIVVLILLSIATPVGWPAFAAVGTLWFVQKFTYFAHARQRAEK